MQDMGEVLAAYKAMDAAAEPFIPSAIADADVIMMHMIVVGRAIARKFHTDDARRKTVVSTFHFYLDVIIKDELHKLEQTTK